MGSKKKFKNDFGDITTFDENDISDSDDDFPDEKRLLEKVRKKREPDNYDSDDEVYGLNSDDDDNDDNDEHDSMESDIERPQEDENLPDERAWGKKKKNYFSTDYVDADYATTNEKDMERAELEEEMARSIQKKLAEQLDDSDFGLDLFQLSTSVENDKINDDKDTIKTDLSTLSKREKLNLFEKENPEFYVLVKDFEERLMEVKNILLPFLNLAKQQNIPECPALNLFKIKYHLILNYSVNLSFYLELKSKKISINSHPVIKRLAQIRKLIIQLEDGQGKLINEASEILKAVANKQPLYNVLNNTEINMKNIKKRKLSNEEIDMENKKKMKEINSKTPWIISEPLDNEENEVKDIDNELDENSDNEENEELKETNPSYEVLDGEKRPINYKIAKNKGLTPHRKKEQRNPRVKHRNKYRKAKIRRKGAVREVRKEITRYDGEISGIKASVMKSRKLK